MHFLHRNIILQNYALLFFSKSFFFVIIIPILLASVWQTLSIFRYQNIDRGPKLLVVSDHQDKAFLCFPQTIVVWMELCWWAMCTLQLCSAGCATVQPVFCSKYKSVQRIVCTVHCVHCALDGVEGGMEPSITSQFERDVRAVIDSRHTIASTEGQGWTKAPKFFL